ncbi:MAG: EamA family transporter RarD [Mangrovicoccus sp.]
MTEPAKGIAAMIAACCVWGLSGIFYKALSDVPATELLAHRMIWSLLFFLAVLAVQNGLGQLRPLWQSRDGFRASLAAGALISVNWFGFIYAVQNGYALQASLGYYIFPLIAVLLGVVALKDALSRRQSFAVALAAIAVLGLSIGLGVAPWLALLLATTFGFYGLVKKLSPLTPLASVVAEVIIVIPFAIGYLAWLEFGSGLASFGQDLSQSFLLACSGPLTGLPLLLFTYASRRVNLSTMGLIQYINPSLQFLVAVFLFNETFTWVHGFAFALIWTALAIYSSEKITRHRARTGSF